MQKTRQKDMAAGYIGDNFKPDDRIAVVLLNRRTGAALQRIAAAERVAAPEFQAWLRHMNAQKHEVYVSMNTLKEGAGRRTKEDVGRIRHVYLDFDDNGTAAVEALLKREDLPEPNYVISSSPDKWQVIWKIEGCSKHEAEGIERGLVSDTGADPAVIDVARVLRLPGFYNHKYGHPHLVTAESRSERISRPEQFPRFAAESRNHEARARHSNSPPGRITQSERDWAYVRGALRPGAPPEGLIEELKVRRSDKFNPDAYARRTVEKAVDSVKQDDFVGPDR